MAGLFFSRGGRNLFYICLVKLKFEDVAFGVCVLTLPSVTGHLPLRRLSNLRSGSGQVCEGCDVHIQAELHSDSPEHFGEQPMLVRV